MAAGERIRKSQENAVGTIGQHAIGKTGLGVGIVDHQRLAAGDAHQCTRKGRKTAEAEHEIRRSPANDVRALHACPEQCERAEHELLPALAADACEGNAFELDAVLRHQFRFHAMSSAEPEHPPSARDESRCHREPWKDVAAGAAGGDHHGACTRAHTVNPRSNRRFS
jgi:hypothetical protein